MASNKFFTIMVVPEKTQQVKKIVIPSYVFKGGILAIAFVGVLATIMLLDYANVMNQISENKQLKVENRQLRQSVQVFKNKMITIENTLDRVKTFATKLRIITNIEEFGGPPATQLPPAMALPPAIAPQAVAPFQPGSSSPVTPAGSSPTKSAPANPLKTSTPQTSVETDTDEDYTQAPAAQSLPIAQVGYRESAPQAVPMADSYQASRNKRLALLAALSTQVLETATLTDADTSLFVKTEFERLDAAYEEVNKFAVASEQEVQHILERLGEKRTLLASTPTRLPTLGYITSDYGVRISPYDGRKKMHEGIDIANRWGSDIISPADGVVAFAAVKPGYGKMVIIDHDNGIETVYAHSSKFYVKAGDKVRRGQRIAAVGSTGHSTGPHCHYEVRAEGLPVDPCWYILDHPQACRNR